MPDGPGELSDTMALLNVMGAGLAAVRRIPRVASRAGVAVILCFWVGFPLNGASCQEQASTVAPSDTHLPASIQPMSLNTGLVTIESDQQRADQVTGVITAIGNVRIVYPDQRVIATARQAQYFSKENRVVLSGDVDIVQEGGSLIRAERVIYLLDSQRLAAIPPEGQQVFSRVPIQQNTSPKSPHALIPNSSQPVH